MKINCKKDFIKGEIFAPSSKSALIRYIAISVLSHNPIKLKNVVHCDDSLRAADIIKTLGASVKEAKGEMVIKPKFTDKKEVILNCGESALCIRMFAPISCLKSSKFILNGCGSLKTRPMKMVKNALTQLGVQCSTNNGFLPIKKNGKIYKFNIKLDGSITSQLLSGVLITLPKCGQPSTIRIENPASLPYIKLTLSIMKQFGVNVKNINYKRFEIEPNQQYRGGEFTVEGDYSGAAFFLVMGALYGKVRVDNLLENSLQADRAIVDILSKVGAKVKVGKDFVEVSKATLSPFTFNATNAPDLFPPLVALASRIEGRSTIKGVNRLKDKESNRGRILTEEFVKFGVKIKVSDNKMEIWGNNKARITDCFSHNDHRIAMALATASLKPKDKISIKNSSCVNKSYPNFFAELNRLIN